MFLIRTSNLSYLLHRSEFPVSCLMNSVGLIFILTACAESIAFLVWNFQSVMYWILVGSWRSDCSPDLVQTESSDSQLHNISFVLIDLLLHAVLFRLFCIVIKLLPNPISILRLLVCALWVVDASWTFEELSDMIRMMSYPLRTVASYRLRVCVGCYKWVCPVEFRSAQNRLFIVWRSVRYS